MTPRQKTCAWCGDAFSGTREDMCSTACGDAWRAAKRKRDRATQQANTARMLAGLRRYHASLTERMRHARRAAA